MASIVISDDQIKSMQNIGLNMLLFFDDFCKKNNLTYFLCGGCCIGTIRNSKFVPWDDDVDVFMPRKDYEILKKIWINTDKYSIQYTDKKYLTENQFLTICDNDTTFIKTYQKDLDINHGVVLDVLPLDGCPLGTKRKIQKMWALLYSLFIVGKAPENHGKIVYYFAKVVLTIFHSKKIRYYIWKHAENQMTKYSIDECDYITELCSGPHYMQNEYPKRIFEKQLFKEFEGYFFPIPQGYDEYLTMVFGNYMELPPVEKRVCHHEFEFMDMNNSYKKYRGIYYYNNSKK